VGHIHRQQRPPKPGVNAILITYLAPTLPLNDHSNADTNIDTPLLQFQVPKSQKCGQKARVWDVEAWILKEGQTSMLQFRFG